MSEPLNDGLNDPALKALFEETAAGINPQGDLDDIKERIMTEQSNRRWVLPAVAAAAVMALVVGGVGWMLREDDDKSTLPTTQPTADATGTTDPGDPPVTKRMVEVFYLGETTAGPRLFSEKHELQGNSPYAFGTGAINESINVESKDPDYYSAWPDGISVATSTAETPGVVDVDIIRGTDLSRPAGMTEQVARLSLEQLVRSFQAGAGRPVKLRFFYSEATGDGGATMTDDQIDSIFGIDTSEPLGTRPDDDVMAPLQITNLVDGQKVPAGTLTVTGVAAAFEANVQWEVTDANGKIRKTDYTTAAECCTLAPYSFDVDLEPGTYTITVHDEDMSGEGRPVNSDTKRIVVE